MGDPKKNRKKYSGPRHPWRRANLEAEAILMEEYGLKNKKDLWKSSSKLSHIKAQAKSLIKRKNVQGETERKLFLERLGKMKLIGDNATIENVLDLQIKDILERRLQTILVRKSLAHSMKQSRQFITHRHILVNKKKVDAPSYIVSSPEESGIEFDVNSPFADPEHPERQTKESKELKDIKKEETEEEKIEQEEEEAEKEIEEVAKEEEE